MRDPVCLSVFTGLVKPNLMSALVPTRIFESDDVSSDQAGNRRAEQYAILCASLQRDVQDAAGEAADEFGFTPTQTTLIAGCA
jgi:hypothetical protein